MTYQVPLPSSEAPSQYFVLFDTSTPIKAISINVPRKDDKGKTVLKQFSVLEGGRLNYNAARLKMDVQGKITTAPAPGPQLTSRVSPTFSNEVFEHATQEGFSLDHAYEKLNVIDIEATLYEGRVERLTKLNELRTGKTLLTIVTDMGVFEDYIISGISPEMHSGSANTFDVSITFQEVRRIELISPSITSYKDDGVEHGNDTKDEGAVKLSLKRTDVPKEKEASWLGKVAHFFVSVGFIK